jgi:hypothetical protein
MFQPHLHPWNKKARSKNFCKFTARSGIFCFMSGFIGRVPDRGDLCRTWSGTNPKQRNMDMSKTLVTLALMCASLQAQVTRASIAASAQPSVQNPATSVNPVIEWNRTLLVILRTAGAQPPTIHSTRSFAILHASIFDAVNNIDGTYSPYMVRLSNVSRLASQPAAADQAAHDVLVALYPAFQTTLDAELQQDLAQIPEGQDKTDGVTVGQTVAAEILAFRSTDGASVNPPPYIPGNQPGDYQFTAPNFAPADFTQWP